MNFTSNSVINKASLKIILVLHKSKICMLVIQNLPFANSTPFP